MRHVPTSTLLRSGGFGLHGRIGDWLSLSFSAQCVITTVIAACLMVSASGLDHSWFLLGRDFGLFQHPAIWSFLALQMVLPLTMRASLKRFLKARRSIGQIIRLKQSYAVAAVLPLRDFVEMKNVPGRTTATLLYSIGFAAFVWNTFQNQLPNVLLPYDFWDSKNYLCGFIVTRIYKLYLFAWLLPYAGMIHVGILFVTLSMLRDARMAGQLRLVPFHPDGVGGLGFLPSLITTPVIVTVLLGAAPVAAAFRIHRSLDVTPVMGLAILVSSALAAYLIPILFLRSHIIALKREMIERLRTVQQTYYTKIVEAADLRVTTVQDANAALEYFQRISVMVGSIPLYPHLRRILGFIGIAMTPSAISLILKLYDYFGPVLKKA